MTYLLRKILPISPIIVLFLLIWSCQKTEETRDIKAFYFPIDDLSEGLVYEYRNPNYDSIANFYNYFRKIEQNDSTFLVGMQYNYQFEPQQLTVEEQLSNGMLLTKSILYQNDETGKQFSMPMEIEVGSAFPFEVRDSGGVFVYNVKWHDAIDSSKFTRLIRNRSFGGDTTAIFKQQTYPAIKMNVREKIESFDDGFVEHEFNSMEVYAKGIGLIFYRKNISPELIIEYQLVDQYPMSVLEQKAGEKVNINQ